MRQISLAAVTRLIPSGRSFTAFVLAVALCLPLVVSTGCSKKETEEERLQKEREWAIANLTEGKTPPPKPAPLPKDLVIEIPASVKAMYKGVVLAVGNRKTREVTKFNVMLGETAKVPGTPYTIKVESYLPTWALQGGKVTSRRDEPDDPAVRVYITQDGETVFDGFIFQKHKTPSFMTEEHVIALVGAIKK